MSGNTFGHLFAVTSFGESHGHIALEDYNMIMEVTAITHRASPVLPSIISQVTPSESSVIKRVAYEPRFLGHLRDHLGIKGVNRVALHEPLTNLRRVIAIQFARETPAPTGQGQWWGRTGPSDQHDAVHQQVEVGHGLEDDLAVAEIQHRHPVADAAEA